MERGDSCGPTALHPALTAHWALLSPTVASLFPDSLSHYKKAPGEGWREGGVRGPSAQGTMAGTARAPRAGGEGKEMWGRGVTRKPGGLSFGLSGCGQRGDNGGPDSLGLEAERRAEVWPGPVGNGCRGPEASFLCHIGLLCTGPASKHVMGGEGSRSRRLGWQGKDKEADRSPTEWGVIRSMTKGSRCLEKDSGHQQARTPGRALLRQHLLLC